jgi:hypothetical protein
MPGLLGDDAFGDPGGGAQSRKAGPHRVTGHLVWVESGTGGVALQHRLTAESCRADPAMAVHRAKGGSLGGA